MIHKICKACFVEKPLELFSKGQGKYKKLNVCRICDAQARNKRYWAMTPEQHEVSKEAQRVREYKRIYGLNDSIALSLAKCRVGDCKICSKLTKLVVDHCHKTNMVRGLICDSCNKMLGHSFDNPDTLMKAVHYLSNNAATDIFEGNEHLLHDYKDKLCTRAS